MTKNGLTLVPADDEHEDATQQLWRRFARPDGLLEVSGITDQDIERLRADILAGTFPAVIETDYTAGYMHYARGAIAKRFIRYRQTVSRHKVRKYFPILESAERRAAMWQEASKDPAKFIQYAEGRMKGGIETAIMLHGATLRSYGDVAFGDIEALAYDHVKDAIQKLESQEATTEEDAS